MRRIALFVTTSSFLAFGTAHCVSDAVTAGDSPGDASASDSPSSNDGSPSDATAGDGAQNDGAMIGDANAGDTSVDSGPTDTCIGHTDCPNNVEGANLQLWLRGDVGESCLGGRLATWSDQSGKGNHAHPGTHQDTSGALGPKCGLDTINARAVPTFTAPVEPDGGDGGVYTQYVDETLGVNLAFVTASDYTLFVVHRRAANGAFGLIGEDRSVVPGGLATVCFVFMGVGGPQDALSLAYSSLTDGGQALFYSQNCAGTYSQTNTYAPLTTIVDEIVYASAVGHSLYANGVAISPANGSNNDRVGISDAGNPGVIGRGFNRYTTDTRYKGNIAEVIGYKVALTDPERAQVEAYLKRQWALTF